MQISLSDEAQSYVSAVVADGDYADASAFVEALIKVDSARFDNLRAQIQEGFDSDVSPFSGGEIVARAFEDYRRKCA